MVIRLGSNAESGKLYVGPDEVQKVYRGVTQVWPDTGVRGTTFSIVATRTTGTAPAGVMFEVDIISNVLGITDPQKDCDIRWDMGVDMIANRLSGELPWSNNCRIQYGHVAQGVFPSGNYTVTCEVYDGVSTVTETIQVAIDDFETEYPTSVHTIGSDPSDDYATFAAAYAAHSGDAYQKYTLRRGDVFNESFIFDQPCNVLQLAAHGVGADPRIVRSFGVDDDGIRTDAPLGDCEIAIFDIEIRGDYDPTVTPARAWNGNPANCIRFQKIDGLAEFESYAAGNVNALHPHTRAFKTVTNCQLSGLRMGLYWDAHINCYFHNLDIHSWADFGTYAGDGGYCGYTGMAIKQSNATINMYDNRKGDVAPYVADHGPHRLSRPWGPHVFSRCDLRSRNSWGFGSQIFQGCLRWNSGNGMANAKGNFDMLRLEGGTLNFGNGTTDAFRQNVIAVFDRILFFGHGHEGLVVFHGGTTVRNMVWCIPDIKPLSSVGVRNDSAPGFSTARPWADGITDQTAKAVEFYSCSMLDDRSDQNATNGSGSSGPRAYTGFNPSQAWANYLFENNIGQANNRTSVTGETAFNPLDRTNTLSDIGYDGLRILSEVPDTEYEFVPADSPVYGIPQPGSAAIGSAAGKVSKRDFFENLRDDVLSGLTRTEYTQGPFEPDIES